jgi:hypothetical protein
VREVTTGPVAAVRSTGTLGANASGLPFDLALPPAVAVLTLLAAVAAQLLYVDRVALRVGRPEREGGPRT